MNFISTGIFWGSVIVFIGLSIILREVFHIQFPFVRVLIGLVLIYWGVRVIAGGYKDPTRSMFANTNTLYDGTQREYNLIFGSSTIDMFKAEIPSANNPVEVNTIFGNTVIIVNDSIPVRVKMEAAFGQVTAPGKNVSGFGEAVFTTSAYDSGSPAIEIKADAVFGRIVIEPRRW